VCRQRYARAQGESAAHVAATGNGIEFSLRWGRALTLQEIVLQRNVESARQWLGKFQRLVVAALAQAAAVQRHGKNKFRQDCGARLGLP